LGRNLKHLVTVVRDLEKRGVGFKVLSGAPIDTATSQGKLMFAIFAGLAVFERDVIRERTIAGLAAERARARKGRPEIGFHEKQASASSSRARKPRHERGGAAWSRRNPRSIGTSHRKAS